MDFAVFAPAFLEASKALLTSLATTAAVTSISLAVDLATPNQLHEKQLQACLKGAFKQTSKQYQWIIEDKSALMAFQSTLKDFSNNFDQSSLSIILETTIGKELTQEEIDTWIDNLIKQLSLNKHSELREYLKMKRVLVYPSAQMPAADQNSVTLSYLLTYTTPVWDNKDVICRDDIINNLFAKFSTGVRRIQVAGMGGLGKSEILVKFFYQLNQPNAPVQFDYIGFIRFNDDLESDFRSQIPYLADYARKNGEEAAKLFLQQLCATNRVLFCIDDNRDKKEIFKNNDPSFVFLKTLNASILFASRTEYADFEQQPFPPLSTEACIEVFQRMYGQEIHNQKDIDILTNIIEELSGNNTLIVNRLGNMAKENNFTIDKLHKNLQDKNFHIKTGCMDEEELQQQISKLYPLSDLTKQGERSIVEAFSIFPVNPLPTDLCEDWLHEDAGIDEEECSLALTRLSKQTWLEKRINISDGEVLFSMHQCVKSAVKDQTTLEYSAHQGLVKNCRTSLNNFINTSNLQKSLIIIPFAVSIFKELFQNLEPFSALSIIIARYFYESAGYSVALEWLYKALAIHEKTFGKEHPNTASTYNSIANVCECQGKYALALEWSNKALNIREKILGKDHPDTATSYNDIAVVYFRQGQYDLALEWYNKVIPIREKLLGKDHPDTATSYNNVALVYYMQGQYNLALEWHKKSLAISVKVRGGDDPSIATTYNNIALVYNDQGEYDLALEYYQKALEIREKVYGKDHPHTATIYNNLACLYQKRGQYDLALKWFKKYLTVVEKVFGKDHPSIATACNNIAFVYEKQSKYALALEWYQKALAVVKITLGETHPNTIIIKKNLETLQTNFQGTEF